MNNANDCCCSYQDFEFAIRDCDFHPEGLATTMLTTNKLMMINPKSVSPVTPIKEARLLMEAEGTLQLPVIKQDKLVGIITDRDICLAIHAPVTSEQIVADFMTADPITVAPETPVFRTAQMLAAYKFGALPVVDGDELVGLITSSLLLAYFANNLGKR